MVVVYILLYDPTVTLPECPSIQEITKSFICPLGAKINLRSNTGLPRIFVFCIVQVVLYPLLLFVYECCFRNTHPFLAQVALNHFGFQEPDSPLMEGLIALHSDIWAIMLFVAGFVLYMMCATLYSFDANTTQYSYKVHHHSLIEIIWTTIPTLILCIIAVPSFILLYSLDETVEPSLTIKAIEWQWYWSYEYRDYNSWDPDTKNYALASPNEPSSGWFSSMKTYWGFGKNNQPLSPLEANQKTLDTLQNAQHSTLSHCKKYDDSLIKGSLSPRSYNII